MKQSRRKELKTNELGIWLNDLYDSAQRNANYLLGALLVVVLLVVGTMVVRHNRMAKVQSAWNAYYDLRNADLTKDPDALNRARELAQTWAGDSDLGPYALQLSGDMAYNLALDLPDPKDKDTRIQRLKQAKSSYEQMLSNYASVSDVSNAARMSLAAVEESLVVEGQGDTKQIRELYEKVIAAKPNVFANVAEQDLKTLDERLKPLQIIATRPAEAVATAPSATSGPAAISGPTATRPHTAGGTRPAMPRLAPPAKRPSK
jgi:hypothetical protein